MNSIDAAASAGPQMTAESFDRAVRLVLPALRGYTRRLTRDPAQSDDLIQDTLLRAWAARHRFVPDTNFKAWLFRIAYNCFVSALRKSRRIVWLSPELEIQLTVPAMQEEALMMRDLDRARARLSVEQIAALDLIQERGLCYVDAAEQLGINVGTAKSRVARARIALKLLLSGDKDVPAAVIPRIDRDADEVETGDPVQPMPVPSRYAAWKASGQRLIG